MDGIFFNAQWVAFAMTLGGLALLGADWYATSSDGTLIAFRDLHQRDPAIEVLAR